VRNIKTDYIDDDDFARTCADDDGRAQENDQSASSLGGHPIIFLSKKKTT